MKKRGELEDYGRDSRKEVRDLMAGMNSCCVRLVGEDSRQRVEVVRFGEEGGVKSTAIPVSSEWLREADGNCG